MKQPMLLTRLLVSIIALFVATPVLMAVDDNDIIEREAIFNADGIPSAKLTVSFGTAFGTERFTIITDDSGEAKMIIKEKDQGEKGLLNSDTTLLVHGKKLYHSYAERYYKTGELQRRSSSISDAPSDPWKYEFLSSSRVNNQLVVSERNEKGNWTKLNNKYRDGSVDSSWKVDRKIDYTLTDADREMLASYDHYYDRLSTSNTKGYMAGAIALVIAIALACFSLLYEDLETRWLPWIAAVATGLIAAYGFYSTAIPLATLLGKWTTVAIFLGISALIYIYQDKIISRAEEDSGLTGSQVYTPVMLGDACLLIAGWYIGGFLFGSFWGSIMMVLILFIPSMSTRRSGERCTKCNRMRGIRFVEHEECGFEWRTEHEGNVTVYRKHRRARDRYRCIYCGNVTWSEIKDAGLLDERIGGQREEAPSRPAPQKSRADLAVENIDYKDPPTGYVVTPFDCQYYDSCNYCRLGNEKKPCNYKYRVSDCPYFGPTESYKRNLREHVRSGNTPI